jgi:tetratricopeptide (TPR) repeat protein
MMRVTRIGNRPLAAAALVGALSVLCAQQPADTLHQGIAAFHKGDYKSARELLQKVLDASPGDSRARVFVALSQAAGGSCADAVTELRQQFSNNPDGELRRLAGLALVQCHTAQNRMTELYPVLLELQARFPSDADVLYQAARVHMKAWNDAVLEMYRRAPASYRVNQLSGEIFETQGRYTEAAAEYRKAIAKNPAAVNLHYRLGRALLLESHQPDALREARKQFEAELAINPEDAVCEYQIGQILLAEQKPGEAAIRFERAVRLSPEFPEALVALARIRMSAKRNDEAIQLLERAVKLQPQMEAAHYSLMLAYRNAGRSEDAQREKEEVDRLRRPPEGEFTEFLKKLGETTPKR